MSIDQIDITMSKIMSDLDSAGISEAGEDDRTLWRAQYYYKGFRCKLGKVYGGWYGFAVHDKDKVTIKSQDRDENLCGYELHKRVDAYARSMG